MRHALQTARNAENAASRCCSTAPFPSTMKALRDGTKAADIQGLPAPSLVRAATRADDYDQRIKDWLGGKG